MKTIYLLFVILASSFIIIFFVTVRKNKEYKYIPLNSAPKLKNQVPAGEIIKGFDIVQMFNIDEKTLSMIQKYNPKKNVCIGILMASYGNRENSGYIEVELSNELQKAKEQIDVSTIKDNVKHIICFKNFKLTNLHKGKYKLSIKGISSIPRQAVTAWLTKDSPHGVAICNSRKSQHGLVFSLYTRIKRNNETSYYSFIIIYLLNILLFTVAFLYYKQNKLR